MEASRFPRAQIEVLRGTSECISSEPVRNYVTTGGLRSNVKLPECSSSLAATSSGYIGSIARGNRC